jgi:hypothetical protein
MKTQIPLYPPLGKGDLGCWLINPFLKGGRGDFFFVNGQAYKPWRDRGLKKRNELPPDYNFSSKMETCHYLKAPTKPCKQPS